MKTRLLGLTAALSLALTGFGHSKIMAFGGQDIAIATTADETSVNLETDAPASANTLSAGDPGYIGFSLESDSGLVHGWVPVPLNPNTSEGSITSWADETDGTSIVVGVPEPGTILLSLLALAALALRRMR